MRDTVANQGTDARHVTCLLICDWSGEGRVPVHQVAPPGVRRLLAAPLSQGAGQEGGGQAGHTQPAQYLHTIYTLSIHYLHTIYTLSKHYIYILYTIYTASTNFLYTIYIFHILKSQYPHSIYAYSTHYL